MRLILQRELTARCSKNPNYSLRSFAKFLSISPAALSALLNKKRPITDKMKERLGLKLGFSLVDLKKFESKPHGNSKLKVRQQIDNSFQQITLDIFSIISEPHHYALLELLKTDNFESKPRWIASRLGITPSEVNIAIERLERAGLLERHESGALVDSTKGFTTDLREGLTSKAQRRYQIKSLQNAIEAVETVPLDVRDNTSMTMAIHLCDLPKAKQMIKDFRRSFCRQMESNPELNEVYQLNISFVPITTIKNKKKAD